MKLAVIIPVLNAEKTLSGLLASIEQQTIAPDYRVVLDSESDDSTVAQAVSYGWTIVPVKRADFDHGGTRQQAVNMFDAEIIIFMTQDTVLADVHSLQKLLECFADELVGAAYGRQLPRPGAGLLEAHSRLFNYPQTSQVKSFSSIPQLGIKAAFLSDSFAAYRRSALEAVGGFPARIISGEDMIVGAKLLMAGWRIAYCAEAMVYHSHRYNCWQEFQRYFDTGVMHSNEKHIIEPFGKVSGEGWRYVCSELSFVGKQGKWRSGPGVVFRNMLKYAGYRLGRCEQRLPLRLKMYFSMNRGYWKKSK